MSLILAGILCCGCVAKTYELSTNSQESEENVHKESTLSTEESTFVDSSVEESQSISCEEKEKNSTENDGESQDSRESEKDEESAKYSDETEGKTLEEDSSSQEDEDMKLALADAAYYYTFYASIYQTRDKTTSLIYDETAFIKAYQGILEEHLEDYFTDISWIMREEGISLSFIPTQLLFPAGNEQVYIWMARCIHAYSLVEETYSEDEHWDHPDSLKPQFHCHTIYARQKKLPWNIEPYRTETSFLRILLYQGNPEG